MGHWLTFANVDWAHRYDSGAGPRRTGVRQPWLDSAQDLQSRSAPADGPKQRFDYPHAVAGWQCRRWR